MKSKVIRLNEIQIAALQKALNSLNRDLEMEIFDSVQNGFPETEHIMFSKLLCKECKKLLKKLEDDD